METQTLRKPSVERREEIAAAALRLIGERGRTALTTANLAVELGLSSGALFRHFATLDDVLRGAVALGVQKIEATFPDETLPPFERLFALARRRVQVLGGDAGLAWLVRSDEVHLKLPEDALAELRRRVGVEGRSQAALIGEALRRYIEVKEVERSERPPIPRIGRQRSGRTDVSDRAEELLRPAADSGWLIAEMFSAQKNVLPQT